MMGTAVFVTTLVLPGLAPSATVAAPNGQGSCDKIASANGSDSKRGTRKAPYRTPRKLLRSLASGQTGCLRGGSYGSVSAYHNLTASNVTLTSYPGETALIKGYVEVLGSNVTLRGLVFDGSNTVSGAGACGSNHTLPIQLRGNRITFEHNEVYQSVSATRGSAIGIGGAGGGNDVIVRRNKIHDFGSCYHFDHGIYLGDGDNVQIYDNWIWNNSNGWGIQVHPGPRNARIYHNVVDANGGGFVISDDGSATSTGNQVYNNVIVNSTGLRLPNGGSIAGAGLSGAGPTAGSGNSFTSNAVFNNPVGGAPNVALSGNMTVNPQFVDAAGHNYQVASTSPLASWGLWDGD